MKKLGILLPHLGPSQLAFEVINQVNYLSSLNNNFDFMLFFDNLIKPCVPPNCAITNSCDILGFDGILISTNIEHAISCSQVINSARNIFYVWDLEWLRGHNNFINNMAAFRNPQIEVVARSYHHAQAIENYCNKKIEKVIQDINLVELSK